MKTFLRKIPRLRLLRWIIIRQNQRLCWWPLTQSVIVFGYIMGDFDLSVCC